MADCLQCGGIHARKRFCSHECARIHWRRHNNRRKNELQQAYRIGAGADRSSERAHETRRLHARPFVYLIRSAKSRAKKKGFEYDLDLEWASARWSGKCEITGIQFIVNAKAHSGFPYSPSIDRIDNSKGYLKNNCRFVIFAVNAMKGTGSDSDMVLIARALASAYSPERSTEPSP
jgi:hypothetical protein